MRENKKSSVELRTTFLSFLRSLSSKAVIGEQVEATLREDSLRESRKGKNMGSVPVFAFILTLAILMCQGLYAPNEALAASNNYGTATSAGGPLAYDGTQQQVVSIATTKTGGGVNFTTWDIIINGTVGAGDVTEVSVYEATIQLGFTAGSYGSGSNVSVVGASHKPATPTDIMVKLASSACGKTVGVTLQSTNAAGDTGLPNSSTNVSIAACPDSTPPTTSGLTFTSPVSGSYVGSPFNFTGDLTDNESNVTSCSYCVKNGAECTSGDTWAAGSLSGSSPTWTCTASSVSLYTNGSGITSGDSVYIDVRGTSTGGQNDNGGTAISKTMDKTAPTTTDNQSSSNWQATEKTVTLTPNDGTGSGVTAATGIYGCFGTACSPSVLGSNSMTTACGAGNACTYDVRYYSVDNVGNTESTVTSSYQAKVDRAAPAAVADLAGPTSTATSVNLTWTNPSDGTGSGNASFDVRYRIGATFVEGDWASASLATGEPTPPSTGMTVSSLTCGTTYAFAIKTTDNVGNISTISNALTQATSACAAGPSLSQPTETGYTDYKNPDSGSTTTDIRFKVIYQSSNAPTYVRVCIGDNDDSGSYPCYDMTADTGCAAPPYCNSDYSDGEQFVYGPIGLGAAQDIRFYFEAQDTGGTTKLPSDAPTSYYTGPAVYLLWTQNRVGVPKCLGGGSCTAGLSYSSVLGDDSGYSRYCYDYKLISASDYGTAYVSCVSGNVKTGRGYWIWASNANTYRLDEKNLSGSDLAGNVSTSPFSIIIGCYQGGSYKSWNMISNPYNKRIPLDGASGPRVMVEKITVDANCNETVAGSEVTFGTAVGLPNEWVGNAIYEWEGPVNADVPRLYSNSATVLEPWVGYWIFSNLTQSGYAIKLKVYRE